MHPILARIGERMLCHARKLEQLVSGKTLAEISANMPEIDREVSELQRMCKDLNSYLPRQQGNSLRELINATAEMMHEQGVEYSTIVDVLARAGKRRKGRQVEVRDLALQGIMLKPDNPNLGWDEVAKKLKYPATVADPKARLVRDVRRFKAILRKYSITLP